MGDKGEMGKAVHAENPLKASGASSGGPSATKVDADLASGLHTPADNSFKRKSPTSVREKHYNWHGGIWHFNGYRYILKPEHPRAKSKKGYVAEHVLAMEKKLGRYLLPNEVVHHINEHKQDNRLRNLRLFQSNAEHIKQHKKI